MKRDSKEEGVDGNLITERQIKQSLKKSGWIEKHGDHWAIARADFRINGRRCHIGGNGRQAMNGRRENDDK